MPEELKTLYKLMTMYALSRVDFPLTNAQIANLFLDLEYTNYFNVQYALGELVESGLVREETRLDMHCYTLTPEGRESVEALRGSLASSIRSDIDSYLKENRLELREALSTRAEYYRTTGGDYAVRCRVMDHEEALIDMTLQVPNEDQAKAVGREWKERSQEIYAQIIRMLARPSAADRQKAAEDSKDS